MVSQDWKKLMVTYPKQGTQWPYLPIAGDASELLPLLNLNATAVVAKSWPCWHYPKPHSGPNSQPHRLPGLLNNWVDQLRKTLWINITIPYWRSNSLLFSLMPSQGRDGHRVKSPTRIVNLYRCSTSVHEMWGNSLFGMMMNSFILVDVTENNIQCQLRNPVLPFLACCWTSGACARTSDDTRVTWCFLFMNSSTDVRPLW